MTAQSRGGAVNIIDMLEADHRKVEGLFAQYEAGSTEVVAEIAKELTMHTKIEEQVVYPVVRESLPNGAEEADHAKQEHDKVDEFLAELEASPTDSDCFEDLKSEVEHHVQEEESNMFPQLREACDAAKLEEMGTKAEEMKASS
jgi:iron-sulfur cluster repair protein YtfE (RIC family)